MPVTQDKVECRTPTPGKKPTRIERWKFDAIRRAILEAVRADKGGVLFSDLTEEVRQRLSADELQSVGSLMWYVTTVKLELEVRDEIRRVPGETPQRLVGGHRRSRA
jgi:hypothetical protein